MKNSAYNPEKFFTYSFKTYKVFGVHFPRRLNLKKFVKGIWSALKRGGIS